MAWAPTCGGASGSSPSGAHSCCYQLRGTAQPRPSSTGGSVLPASLGWDEAGLQPRLCVFSLLQLSPSRPPELHRGPSQRAPALQGQASGSCLPGCGQFSWMRLPPSFGASGTPPAFSLQTGPASGPGCLGFPRKRPPVPTPQCWGLSSMCGSLMLDRDGSEQHGL